MKKHKLKTKYKKEIKQLNHDLDMRSYEIKSANDKFQSADQERESLQNEVDQLHIIFDTFECMPREIEGSESWSSAKKLSLGSRFSLYLKELLDKGESRSELLEQETE